MRALGGFARIVAVGIVFVLAVTAEAVLVIGGAALLWLGYDSFSGH